MRRIFFYKLSLLIIVILSGAAAGRVSGQTGLAAQWKGEDNFSDVRGAAAAAPHNTPTFADGFVGRAFSFQTQAYLTVPYQAIPNGRDRLDLTDLTIEGWIKPSVIGERQVIISKTMLNVGGGNINFGDVYMLELDGGTLKSSTRQPDNTTRSLSSANGSILPDVWYHVAFTHDRETGQQRLYLNGTQVDSQTAFMSYAAENGAQDLTIAAGRNVATGALQSFFGGSIDELSLYHRDLSGAEIAAIYARGANGKAIEGTDTPPDLLGWWAMEDDFLTDYTDNIHDGFNSGSNNFTDGLVGRSLNLNPSALIGIQNYPTMRPANITIEAWVKFANSQGRFYIIRKNLNLSGAEAVSLYVEDGTLYGQLGDGTNSYVTPFYGVDQSFNNRWAHVALTFDDAANQMIVYVNGWSVSSRTVPISIDYSGNFGWQFLTGTGINPTLVDEVSIYSRAFPSVLGGRNAELEAIAFAGKQGKRRVRMTPAGSFVTTQFRPSITIDFSDVTSGGQTTVTPLDPATPGLPSNFALGTLAFEISTTAVFSDATLCFSLPNWDPLDEADFAQLKLMHQEAGVWVDRTTVNDFQSLTVCGMITSFSPFAVARQLAPTAANVSVGGRVLTSDGSRAVNALVSLTDTNGNVRTARTNSFGNYRFPEVAVGMTYVVSVRHKSAQFSPRILTVFDEIADFDLTADE